MIHRCMDTCLIDIVRRMSPLGILRILATFYILDRPSNRNMFVLSIYLNADFLVNVSTKMKRRDKNRFNPLHSKTFSMERSSR